MIHNIKKMIKISFLFSFMASLSVLSAQDLTVSGEVSDVTGNGVPGVTIQVRAPTTEQ